MREHLYRAWHKKYKKMYEVLHLHMKALRNGGIWADVKGYNCIEAQEIVIQIQPNDIELMEYTGLQDKNGKKIFEGDIVIFSDWPPKIVEYGTSGFAGFGLKGTMKFLMDYDSAELEVIGNIYENSDLVEGIT